jgi:hypothetical protein
MRVVTELGDVAGLLRADDAAVSLALLEIQRSSILHMSVVGLRQALKAIVRDSTLSATVRKRTEVMLLATPLDRRHQMLVDYVASTFDVIHGCSIASIVLDPKYRMLKEQLRECPRAGETRESAFSRLLERHARASTRAVIFDRYLGQQLLRDRELSGAFWLLHQFAAAGVPQVQVITAVGDSASRESIDGAMSDTTSSIGIECDLVVTRFGNLMHDRHVRFVFGNGRGSEAITLGRGADVFRERLLDQDFHVLVMSEANAMRFENAVKKREGLSLDGVA